LVPYDTLLIHKPYSLRGASRLRSTYDVTLSVNLTIPLVEEPSIVIIGLKLYALQLSESPRA
jgi:hypothetical protein